MAKGKGRRHQDLVAAGKVQKKQRRRKRLRGAAAEPARFGAGMVAAIGHLRGGLADRRVWVGRGDGIPWASLEVILAYASGGGPFRWQLCELLAVEVVEGGKGKVRKARWVESGQAVSGADRKRLSADSMHTLRCCSRDELASLEERTAEDEEEDEEEAAATGSTPSAAPTTGSTPGAAPTTAAAAAPAAATTSSDVASTANDEEERVLIREGGRQVDTRYWCVDLPVDFDALQQHNAQRDPLELPTRLEDESPAFREEVVRRAGVVTSMTPALRIEDRYALELVIGALVTTQTRNERSVLVYRSLVSLAVEKGSWAGVTLCEVREALKTLGLESRCMNVYVATQCPRGDAAAAAAAGIGALKQRFPGVGEKCGCVVRSYLACRGACVVVDTRVHSLVNAFGWACTTGGIKGARPYAPHGDVRTYPMPGWSRNTSGAANAISMRWRKVLEGSDGEVVAAYNITLNTLAGQAANDEVLMRALNLTRAEDAPRPLTLEQALRKYAVDNLQTFEEYQAKRRVYLAEQRKKNLRS